MRAHEKPGAGAGLEGKKAGMFYVYVFNGPLEQFECIGAFSREDEADVCLRDAKNRRPLDQSSIARDGWVVRMNWRQFRDALACELLGELAAPIKALAAQMQPNQRL